MEGADPEILAEIELAMREAVGRFGLAGRIVVSEQAVRLEGHGPTVWQPIDGLASKWASLPPDIRSRRAMEIARRLASLRRSVPSGPPGRGAAGGRRRTHVALALALVGLAGLLVAFEVVTTLRARDRVADEGQAFASIEALDAYEAERRARAARVCDATRSRVMRGAAVGPADVEGWVVELSLLGARPIDVAPQLRDHLSPPLPSRPETRRHFVWALSPAISEAEGPATFVELGGASIRGRAGPAVDGVALTFTGRYVVPYFHEKQRADYIRFASDAAARLAAEHGALYARCAHLEDPLLGGWFYGPDPGGAMASLLYFMGTFAPVPHVRASALRPAGASARADEELDRAYAFARLRAVTEPLDKARILSLIGEHGGMLSGPDEGPSIITFPFRDANRASRASRTAARALGIGTNR